MSLILFYSDCALKNKSLKGEIKEKKFFNRNKSISFIKFSIFEKEAICNG
jgi:hypothetical protein